MSIMKQIMRREKKVPLKEIRREKKISQRKLAKLIGVYQQHISLWENGKLQLPIKHAKTIAKELGCSWKDLYED